jgi:hypothetical protein
VISNSVVARRQLGIQSSDAGSVHKKLCGGQLPPSQLDSSDFHEKGRNFHIRLNATIALNFTSIDADEYGYC